jgi:hypothetical protein
LKRKLKDAAPYHPAASLPASQPYVSAFSAFRLRDVAHTAIWHPNLLVIITRMANQHPRNPFS